MAELWPPKQLPLFGPRWVLSGSRCTAPGCGRIRQAVALLGSPVGENNGPQGGWRCEGGHEGWIWPNNCEFPAPRVTEPG